MIIELHGDNCRTCQKLRHNIQKAVKGCPANIEFRNNYDPKQFADYGLLSLPGIIINGQVKSAGKLLSTQKVMAMIEENNKAAQKINNKPPEPCGLF